MRYNTVRCVKPGDKVNVRKNLDNCLNERETFTVVKVYPFFVRCVNSIGIKRCVTYGELVQLGHEKQLPHLEALKMARRSGEYPMHRGDYDIEDVEE